MNQDEYQVPNDCSELTEQEWAEYEFIEQYLDNREIEWVMLACERAEDVIPSQFYFALAKRNGDTEALGPLAEILEDKLKIGGVRLGVPQFTFLS